MGDLFRDFAEWLLDAFTWVPRYLLDEFLDGVIVVFNGIPVPDWLANWASTVAAVSSDIWWAADLFALQEGFLIILSAYIIRFSIRRTPSVG